MDSRSVCTLVVRAFGLWIVVTWFGYVWFAIVDWVHYFFAGNPVGYEPFSFWDASKHISSLLIFLLGAWLLIDGKEVIDQFQYVTRRCCRCGHNLMKVRGENCPECGAPISKRHKPGSGEGSSKEAE